MWAGPRTSCLSAQCNVNCAILSLPEAEAAAGCAAAASAVCAVAHFSQLIVLPATSIKHQVIKGSKMLLHRRYLENLPGGLNQKPAFYGLDGIKQFALA